MEQRPLTRRVLWVYLLAAVVALALASWWIYRVQLSEPPPLPRGRAQIEPRPLGIPRVRVEVLNATETRGLARRATRFLRDRGFDVVEIGTARELHDTTLVLDRSNHPEWAALVAEALGVARVESRPDTSRYLDVTVLVGTTWRPPAEPFYP